MRFLMSKRVLAFDFGASSGRAILGIFENGKIEMKEVHRFSNDPVRVSNTVYWDILRLFYEIKQGMLKAMREGGFDSIGIDTWGVDFALFDEHGCLIENPVHYRDERNLGMIEEASRLIPLEELYNITGIQFMEFNTCFQLLSLLLKRPHILERTSRMLHMPDAFNYLLTGVMKTEYSIATTGQLIDINTNNWSERVIECLNLPMRLFTSIAMTGEVVGELSDDICEELNIPKSENNPAPRVIAVAEHDTQSAITAVPSLEDDFIFISCGTWSLLGTELEKPLINEKSRTMNITNEGGYNCATGFLKNICGLWLIQESRRQFLREGNDYSYAELESLALREEAFTCFIDPDAQEFGLMGNIPERVREFCRRTGQYIPQSVGEIMRCIYESLAMKYRYCYESIIDCTGKNYKQIHIMGGGTKDRLLCSMTADSCNLPVVAGPIEATVLGNIAVQLIAAGEIKDVKEARKIIASSQQLKTYLPGEPEKWNAAYGRFCDIVI